MAKPLDPRVLLPYAVVYWQAALAGCLDHGDTAGARHCRRKLAAARKALAAASQDPATAPVDVYPQLPGA